MAERGQSTIEQRFLAVFAALISALLCLTLASCAEEQPDAEATTRIGSVALSLCGDDGALCGSIQRPLNPANAKSATISIGFKWYSRKAQGSASRGVVTVIDGGPGYGATVYPEDYLEMLAPLRDRFDILIADNRGTGASSPLACKSLDGVPGLNLANVEKCGELLGSNAYYYGSDYAADDLAAILDALKIQETGLYAVSYGSYFAQVFAGRHPQRINRMVLDSAFPVRETTPFFASATPTMVNALSQICARSDDCVRDSKALPRLLETLRTAPNSGRAPDSRGDWQSVTLDPGAMFVALMHSSGGLVAYAEFHAAAAALLDDSDSAPLLRIAAEGVTLHDPSGGSEDPAEFSEALFVAVSCSDYPKLFDIRQPAKIRRAQLETELNKALAVRPDVYAPFTFEEFRRSAFQENTVDLCIDWPQPPQDWRPLVLQNGLSKLSDLPVLVLSGEFDPLTTPVEAATVARQFPKAKHVMVRNAVHAPGVGQPSGCGGTLISQFFGGASFDQSCAQASPPARRVKRFYLNYSELLKANRPGTVPMDQLLAQIGIAAADDAIARRIFGEATGSGLRGGKVSYGPSVESGQTIKLDNVRWVTDVTVSGSINLKPDLQTAVARLNIVGPQTGVVNAVFEWPLKHDESRVRMTENREITYFNRL